MKRAFQSIFLKTFFILTLFSLGACGGIKLNYEKKKVTFNDIDYGFPVKTVDLGERFGKVAYVDEGSGDITVIFLHGLGVYLKYFYHQIKYLKNYYRVIALDFPGLGKSENNPDINYRMPVHIAAVIQFIQSLKLKNLVVIGHSYGGGVAIGVSNMARSLMKKLVLIAPLGLQKFKQATINYMSANYNQILEQTTEVDYNLDNFIQRWHSYHVKNRTQLTDEYLKEYLGLIYSREIDKVYATRKKILRHSYTQTGNTVLLNSFLQFQFPVLVISGKQDNAIPIPEAPDWSRQDVTEFYKNVIKQNTNATLKLIDNCGHMPVIEYPDLVNQYIHEFIK